MESEAKLADGDRDPLAPIERQTLNEITYARLKKALLSGRLEPGNVLTLRGFAATLRTTAMPVRDAVGRLAGEQAIALLLNRGIRIPRLTPEHADEVWRLVERYAAEEPTSGRVMPLGAERAAPQASRSQRLPRKIA
jgi:DNA-binding GntR family transcriptional regulator